MNERCERRENNRKQYLRRGVAIRKDLLETIASQSIRARAGSVTEGGFSCKCSRCLHGDPATAQCKHGPNFSPQHEFYRQVQSVFRNFPGGTGPDGGGWAGAFAIFYAAKRGTHAAGAIQP